MNTLSLLLLAAPLLVGAAETNHEAACRANLKRISGAIRIHRLLHNNQDPAKLSELYLQGLVASLGDFACPASGIRIEMSSEIDGKTDYTLTPIAGIQGLVVRETTPHHAASSVLAAFADGRIAPVALTYSVHLPAHGIHCVTFVFATACSVRQQAMNSNQEVS